VALGRSNWTISRIWEYILGTLGIQPSNGTVRGAMGRAGHEFVDLKIKRSFAGGTMLRSRYVFAALALLAVGAALVLPLSAQDSDPASLEQRVQALEGRIASLERTLNQRLSSIEQKMAAGGPPAGAAPANPLEGEAQNVFAGISRTVAAGDYQKAQAEMAEFMKKYASTNAAKRARRLHEELSVIGKETPADWGIEKWYQGEKDVDLGGGKTTLLVFWEEWCPHCKREVPKLQELYAQYKADGLQMVGLTKITRGSTDEKVSAFISDKSVSYPIAKEDGSLSRHFNVSGIPAAAVVKDGKIVWRGHPAQLNQDQLKSWL